MDVESTATRMIRAGHAVAVRIVGGRLDGYAAALTPHGEVWTSSGLSYPQGCDTAPDPARQAELYPPS